MKVLVELDFYIVKGKGINVNNFNCLCIDCVINFMIEYDMLINYNGYFILRVYKCFKYYGYRKENIKKVRGLDVFSVVVF